MSDSKEDLLIKVNLKANSIQNIFVEIIAEIAPYYPRKRVFHKPAIAKQIEELKSEILSTVPTELCELLQQANGEIEDSWGIFGCKRFLSATEMLDEQKYVNHTNQPLIPLLVDGGGNHHAIDQEGKVYQIDHECPQEPWKVADSLAVFLLQFLSDLKKGQFVPLKENIGLVPLDEALDLEPDEIIHIIPEQLQEKLKLGWSEETIEQWLELYEESQIISD